MVSDLQVGVVLRRDKFREILKFSTIHTYLNQSQVRVGWPQMRYIQQNAISDVVCLRNYLLTIC